MFVPFVDRRTAIAAGLVWAAAPALGRSGASAPEEQMITVSGRHRVYAKRYGRGDTGVLYLHGGPGGTHQPGEHLARFASDKLSIILYDQLGSGKSDRPGDTSLFTVERFTAEAERVRQAFGLRRVIPFGFSWGGVLAQQYALDYPRRTAGLVVSNMGSDFAAVVAGMQQRMAALPSPIYRDLLALFDDLLNGRSGSDAGYAAAGQFFGRHLRRPVPFSDEAVAAFWTSERTRRLAGFLLDNPVYQTLWGRDPGRCTGPLARWSVAERLSEIKAPTLVVCGWHDEVLPEVQQRTASGISGAQFVVFGQSSHSLPEEADRHAYFDVVGSFLGRTAAERHRQ